MLQLQSHALPRKEREFLSSWRTAVNRADVLPVDPETRAEWPQHNTLYVLECTRATGKGFDILYSFRVPLRILVQLLCYKVLLYTLLELILDL